MFVQHMYFLEFQEQDQCKEPALILWPLAQSYTSDALISACVTTNLQGVSDHLPTYPSLIFHLCTPPPSAARFFISFNHLAEKS